MSIVRFYWFGSDTYASSVPDNVGLNQIHANKGEARLVLADYLGVPQGATMAFGDGQNDLSMIKNAGISIAMANTCDEAKKVADWIAPSCDEAGVVCGINKFCFEEGGSPKTQAEPYGAFREIRSERNRTLAMPVSCFFARPTLLLCDKRAAARRGCLFYDHICISCMNWNFKYGRCSMQMF